MHRYILNLKKGDMIDHINGNGLDNRRSNLRICTHTQNQANRRLSKNNTSGYKGVWWSGINNKWISVIAYQNKDYYFPLVKYILRR